MKRNGMEIVNKDQAPRKVRHTIVLQKKIEEIGR
jgi:hypothetical protein